MLRRTGSRNARQRRGFTLLEVLLSSAIGVLIMAALYVAVSVQLRHAQAARDLVERSTLARALVNRISADIMPSVAPPLPAGATQSSANAGAAGTGGDGSNTGSSSASSSTSSSAASSSGSSTNTGTTSAAAPTAAAVAGSGPVTLNVGVQGDSTRLTVVISRLPRELHGIAADADTPPGLSDIRRITYWLAGTEVPLGLARQEIRLVTSEEAALAVPPDIPDEFSYIIAEEVKSLTFSYFDGVEWLDSWDGTAPGADGTTPMGPPLAIAILIGISVPGGSTEDLLENLSLHMHRHVVAIPTANGLPLQSTTTP